MLTKNSLLSRADIGDWFPYFGGSLPAGFLWCDGRSLSRTDPLYSALYNKILTRFGAVDGSSFSIPDTRGSAVAHIGTAEATGSIPAYTISNTFNNFFGTGTSTLTDLPAHTHAQSASHTHKGGGFSVSHTHYFYYSSHAGSRSDTINQANTGTQGYYTAPATAYSSASDGTLTDVLPSVALSANSIGVTLGKPINSVGATHSGTTTPHENMMPWISCGFIIKYAY